MAQSKTSESKWMLVEPKRKCICSLWWQIVSNLAGKWQKNAFMDRKEFESWNVYGALTISHHRYKKNYLVYFSLIRISFRLAFSEIFWTNQKIE